MRTVTMRSIWAVATNTIRQAIRMKIAAAFIIIVFILVPVMGISISGDGTTHGKLQSFVTYSLGVVSLLLSLLTIIVSTYTLSEDIKEKRIFTVITKPIRRYQLLFGKLLGIMMLDLLILVPLAVIIYSITLYIPVIDDVSDEQAVELRDKFFTARTSLKPPLPNVQQEVIETYNKLKETGQLPENKSFKSIINNITRIKLLEKRAVAAGGVLRWTFDNVKVTDPNQKLFIRYKYDVSTNPPDLNIYSRWTIGDLRQLPNFPTEKGVIYSIDRMDLVRTFRELEVPSDAIAEDGHIEVAFANIPVNGTVVIFPPDEGLELLYKSDKYTTNFAKAVALLFFRLIFLACLGIFASSFLSFPVAIMLCLLIFSVACVNSFIVDSFGYLSKDVSRIYAYTIALAIKGIPRFDQYSPAQFLVPSRAIGWLFFAKATAVLVFIKSGLVLLLSMIIFKFREIARISA